MGPVAFSGVVSRRLTEETCQRWRYGWAYRGGEKVQVAQYPSRNGDGIVAQKWRSKDKRFGWVGNPKAAETLYGRHLWRDGGKRLIVTEGEIDALSMSQVLDHRWPVVSLANGAGSAERAFRDSLEWLEGFQEVVILFDRDEEGEKAALAAAAILSPGKAKLAILPKPYKDASDLLVAGQAHALVKAQWDAKVWRPGGILVGEDLWSRATAAVDTNAIPYPWAGLQEKLHGLRRREIVTIVAGTGQGKSSVARELGLHLLQSGEKVGWVGLEESVRETLLSMLGAAVGQNQRLRDPDWAALRPAWEKLQERLVIYDHFGSLDSDQLLSRLRYMVKGLGCRWIGFDHLTMCVSGAETENERRDIDVLMTRLRSLVEETDSGLLLVSQLRRRGQGTPYEDGAVPRLSDMRGSAMIEMTSDAVIAVARDQRETGSPSALHVLKNRFSGESGAAGLLEWSLEEGRYTEVEMFDEDAG